MELKTLNQDDIRFKKAEILFRNFEAYKRDAVAIADYIAQIEVTEDSIKDAKVELAAARKVVDALSAKRIEIKKAILSDFDLFESQIKELAGIISEADERVRSKVRILEENERQEKLVVIRNLWEKKAWNYRISAYRGAFDLWFRPNMLNKSTTMKTVEKDLTAWLERTESELDTLTEMGEEYCTEYYSCADMNAAIATVNARDRIREEVKSKDIEPFELEKATFTIFGKKDIAMAQMLLEQNYIEFIKN